MTNSLDSRVTLSFDLLWLYYELLAIYLAITHGEFMKVVTSGLVFPIITLLDARQ